MMGWDIEDAGFGIVMRLDAHAGDKERRHAELADELRGLLKEAIRPVLTNPKFEEILLYDASYYLGEDQD